VSTTDAVIADSHGSLAYHGRSFHLAGRLLPAASRDDAAVCYAFCRLADDAVDEAPDLPSARAALDQLRGELRGERAARPLVAAWNALVARRDIPPYATEGLLDGMESDLEAVRIADDGELIRYCYRAAGTVGLMMAAILEVPAAHVRTARAHAIDLGVAMQLTNIARDVAEDAARDRLYLPADRLSAAQRRSDARPDNTGQRIELDPAAVRIVVRDVLAMAERFYDSGLAGVRYLPARVRPAIVAAAFLYRGIGRALLRRGGDPLAGRVVLGTWERAWLALAGLFAAMLPAPRTPHDPALHLALREIMPEVPCPIA
jgi:phytoene synthase